MSIDIDILEKDSVIKKRLLEALVSEVNIALRSAKGTISSRIKEKARQWLSSTPEIESLSGGGTLVADFGLAGGGGAAAGAIVDSIMQTMVVDLISVSTTAFNGGLIIRMQPSDLSNILSLSAGSYITKKGEKIPWLNWLLTRGDDVIIAKYDVEYGPFGRSGKGKMVSGNAFRVNPSFSGTQEDNFITRAFVGKESEIMAIFKKYVKT